MFDIEEGRYPSAEEIREIIPSSEEIYQARLHSFADSIFSSIATEAQKRKFSLQRGIVDTAFGDITATEILLNDFKKIAEDLGYTVTLQRQVETEAKFEGTNLTIDWSPGESTV